MIKWECLACGWIGKESELVEIDKYPESDDALYIPARMYSCCPQCYSNSTEPIEDAERSAEEI